MPVYLSDEEIGRRLAISNSADKGILSLENYLEDGKLDERNRKYIKTTIWLYENFEKGFKLNSGEILLDNIDAYKYLASIKTDKGYTGDLTPEKVENIKKRLNLILTGEGVDISEIRKMQEEFDRIARYALGTALKVFEEGSCL
ncbi:MAG: hypothetical protein KAT37_04610 [Candidatus Aenigmarchaeota archaeon]|nr:hypothetical protein [Candidatus Aenigmarchaeota archaeon]